MEKRRRGRQVNLDGYVFRHGVGYPALWASVILQAIRDIQCENEFALEARTFIKSPWCAQIFDVLELPDGPKLLAAALDGEGAVSLHKISFMRRGGGDGSRKERRIFNERLNESRGKAA